MLLPAHVRQRRPVDALGAQYIDIVKLGELLWRECFGGSEHHVAGIVYQNVDASVFANDLIDGPVYRNLRLDVELQGAQVNVIVPGKAGYSFNIGRVAADNVSHRGVYPVAGSSEGLGSQAPEAARCPGDQNDFLRHGAFLT